MAHNLFRCASGDRYCSRCDRQWDSDEQVDEPCVPVQGELYVDRYDAAHIPALSENGMDDGLPLGRRREPTYTCTIAKPRGRLIAFAGKKGSGKDTAAKVLIESGFIRVAMAGALKDMLRALMKYRGYDDRLIERHIEGDMKEVPCAAFNGCSMRYAAQTIGTEWGREMIDPDLWVDAVKDRTAYLLNKGENVVITDIRFPNEVDMVRSLGGTVHLIARPELMSSDTHVSENQLDGVQWEHIFHNSGSVDDLHRMIRLTLSL